MFCWFLCWGSVTTTGTDYTRPNFSKSNTLRHFEVEAARRIFIYIFFLVKNWVCWIHFWGLPNQKLMLTLSGILRYSTWPTRYCKKCCQHSVLLFTRLSQHFLCLSYLRPDITLLPCTKRSETFATEIYMHDSESQFLFSPVQRNRDETETKVSALWTYKLHRSGCFRTLVNHQGSGGVGCESSAAGWCRRQKRHHRHRTGTLWRCWLWCRYRWSWNWCWSCGRRWQLFYWGWTMGVRGVTDAPMHTGLSCGPIRN